MSEIFTKYPEPTDVISESDSKAGLTREEYETLTKNVKKLAMLHKKQCKQLKKFRKTLKRCIKKSPVGEEKSTDREISANKETFISEETVPPKENKGTKESEKKEKTFLDKLGDAVIKAFPSILRIVTTAVVNVILGRGLKWFGSRKACIT